MSDERQARIDAIRARHVLDDFGMVNPATGRYEKRTSCKGCHRPWPCEQSVLLSELDAAQARAGLRTLGAGVIVSREWDDEIRARDHSLRQAGAFVLRLFDALAAQDQAIGSGRANRSTPLGELLHDCAPLIANYHARTAAINRLRAERAALANGEG